MQVRTNQKCFVGNAIREAGEVFEYDGPKIEYFEYLDQAGSDAEVSGMEPSRRKPGRPRKGDVTSDSMA